MIALSMVLLMTKWANISGYFRRKLFFQNLSKIFHFASLPSKQTSLNSEVGFISQRNLQGCYDRQGISASTVCLGNSWLEFGCSEFRWLTTDSTMFFLHPLSWKIMPFAQTQMALNHFKPSRNSGFLVFSCSNGVSGCKFTTSTQLEQIPRTYWIPLDPMMRYGHRYRRFPHFFGA